MSRDPPPPLTDREASPAQRQTRSAGGRRPTCELCVGTCEPEAGDRAEPTADAASRGSQVTAMQSCCPQPPLRPGRENWRVWAQRRPPLLPCWRHEKGSLNHTKPLPLLSAQPLPRAWVPSPRGPEGTVSSRAWGAPEAPGEAGPGGAPVSSLRQVRGPCPGPFPEGVCSARRRKPPTPATSGCPGSPQGPPGSGLSSLRTALRPHGPGWSVALLSLRGGRVWPRQTTGLLQGEQREPGQGSVPSPGAMGMPLGCGGAAARSASSNGPASGPSPAPRAAVWPRPPNLPPALQGQCQREAQQHPVQPLVGGSVESVRGRDACDDQERQGRQRTGRAGPGQGAEGSRDGRAVLSGGPGAQWGPTEVCGGGPLGGVPPSKAGLSMRGPARHPR